jgi:hypothetical protein
MGCGLVMDGPQASKRFLIHAQLTLCLHRCHHSHNIQKQQDGWPKAYAEVGTTTYTHFRSPTHGDLFLGKLQGLCITIPSLGDVDVLNTTWLCTRQLKRKVQQIPGTGVLEGAYWREQLHSAEQQGWA